MVTKTTKFGRKDRLVLFFRRHRKLFIGLLVAIFFIVGITTYSKSKPVKDTYTVERQTIEESFSASGKVQAESEAILHFNIPSKVVWVGVNEGQTVKKWQGLARVDSRESRKNLEKALSLYKTNRWDFEEGKDTYQDRVFTDTVKRILEKNQFSLDRAVLDVEISDIVLQDSTLVSPITGTVVSDGDLRIGENISPSELSTKAIHIIDLNTLYFESKVDEIDFSKVTVGQDVSVILDAYPNDSLTGKVRYIGKIGEETSGGVLSIPVEIVFENTDNLNLVTGLNGETFFITNKKENVLVVPKTYVTNENSTSYVYILENGKTKKQQVTTGIQTQSQIEIIDGVSEGDVLVLPK